MTRFHCKNSNYLFYNCTTRIHVIHFRIVKPMDIPPANSQSEIYTSQPRIETPSANALL